MWRYLLSIAFAAALAIAFHYLKQLHTGFAVVLVLACAPVMAWLLAPVFMDLASGWIGFARRSAYGALQGNHYSFDGRRVRFFLAHETIWVAESDLAGILVHAVTDRERRQVREGYGVIPGRKLRGFTEAGIRDLLAARLRDRHASRELSRFNRWLQEEAFPNVRRLPGSAA